MDFSLGQGTIAVLSMVTAAVAFAAEPVASYEREARLSSSGSANYGVPIGEYVYKATPKDGRVPNAPFMLQRPARRDYVFFSPQEARALEAMQERMIAAEKAAELAQQRQGVRFHWPKLVWPRVVVRGVEICVPDLAHSEAADWKEHLLCWTDKGANANDR